MFKEHIDNQIIEYPTLFLKTTYQKSEAMVLDQIFFVIGNGYKWLDGYPLCMSGHDSIIKYNPVDIDKFFEMRNSIYALDIDNEITRNYISNIDIPKIKEFSNNRYIYVKDCDFIEKFNKKVEKDFPNRFMEDIFDRVQMFESLSEIMWKDIVIFSMIHDKYSMIREITKQKNIRKETVRYGLKMLDYAEKLYTGNFGVRSTQHMNKSKFVNPEKELEKIAELRQEIIKYA